MAQQGKLLTSKSHNLRLSPRSYPVEGREVASLCWFLINAHTPWRAEKCMGTNNSNFYKGKANRMHVVTLY